MISYCQSKYYIADQSCQLKSWSGHAVTLYLTGIRINSYREIVYFVLNNEGANSAIVAYQHPFAAYRKVEVMEDHRFILLVLDLVLAHFWRGGHLIFFRLQVGLRSGCVLLGFSASGGPTYYKLNFSLKKSDKSHLLICCYFFHELLKKLRIKTEEYAQQ
jgi:hypothetical protein